MIVAGGLAVVGLSAQDNLDAVRQAADQGDAEAQYNLGIMYNNGEGVPKDDAEAVRWFLLAAEQGHASAQLNLGFMYALGRGVLKDDVLAHMWYNTAGANGDEAARKQRDNLEDDMTRAEISRATELARFHRPGQVAVAFTDGNQAVSFTRHGFYFPMFPRQKTAGGGASATFEGVVGKGLRVQVAASGLAKVSSSTAIPPFVQMCISVHGCSIL